MKFELVEPPRPCEGGTAEPPTGPGDAAHTPASHEALAERMRDRTQELGTRLTRIIEAVRPSIHRMEAGIVRSERELADSGHASSGTVPDTFRADRFTPAASATAPTTTEERTSR